MFTLLGMLALAKLGWFEIKQIPQSKLAQLAAAYVGYIVLCNLSLKVNTVGFYQASAPPSPWVVRGSPLSYGGGSMHQIVALVKQGTDGAHMKVMFDALLFENVKTLLHPLQRISVLPTRSKYTRSSPHVQVMKIAGGIELGISFFSTPLEPVSV